MRCAVEAGGRACYMYTYVLLLTIYAYIYAAYDMHVHGVIFDALQTCPALKARPIKNVCVINRV